MASSLKIYMFDNATGIEIPEKIDVYPVDLLLGTTVSEIHNNIDSCQLFCVFTPISEADIVVETEDDRNMMNTVLQFGKMNYNVIIRENSIWYSDKAAKNIIISNTVKLSALELESIFRLYLNEIKTKKINEGKLHPAEIYTVINIRNSKTIFKTPDITEAKKICDQNPCCAIFDRNGEGIYKSSFGKVAIPYTKNNLSSRYKLQQQGNNGIFNIKQK